MRVFSRTMASVNNRVIYNGAGSARRMVHSDDGNGPQNDDQTTASSSAATTSDALWEFNRQFAEVRSRSLIIILTNFLSKRREKFK